MKNKFLILIIIAASAFTLGCIDGERDYEYSETIAGVNVYSDIPLSELANWDDVLLLHKNESAVIRCNLELSAISRSNYIGPEIRIEESDKTGIYILPDSAGISGKNGTDIMRACHAFACLKEGIACDENLNTISCIIDPVHLNVILDNTASGESIVGFIELFQAFGYAQIRSIDTYLMENNTCKLIKKVRRIGTIYENVNVTDEIVNDCNINGLFIRKSNINEIKIIGEKIILSGDDEHLYSEEIIVSDIIAPNFRQEMHSK